MFVTHSSRKPDYYLYYGRKDPLKAVIEHEHPVTRHGRHPRKHQRHRSRSRRRRGESHSNKSAGSSVRSREYLDALSWNYFLLLQIK